MMTKNSPYRGGTAIVLFFLCIVLAIYSTTLTFATSDADIVANNNNPRPSPPTPPRGPELAEREKRSVRIIRNFIPRQCPMRVLPNYSVSFFYSAHLVTANNTVGQKFDETIDYSVITLQANRRHMLHTLLDGMMNACIDEKRSIVIPHELSHYDEDLVPPKTDTVFIVTIVDIEPSTDLFDAIDKSYDNCITKDELKQYLVATSVLPEYLVPRAVNEYFKKFDKNNDNVLECEELNTTQKHCDGLAVCPIAEEIRQKKLQELLRRQREEAQRIERERLERERLEREEAERLERERLERERVERLERERIEREEALKERERRAIEALLNGETNEDDNDDRETPDIDATTSLP